MRADDTDGVGSGDHFDPCVRTFRKPPVDGREVGHKLDAVAFATEPLQTQQRVRS